MIYAQLDRWEAEAFYRRPSQSNYSETHPWVGQRIWRPVDVSCCAGDYIKEPWDDLLIVDTLTVGSQPKPVKMLKAKLRYGQEGEWIARDADRFGVFCYCFDPIPRDWTYFEILSVHCNEKTVVVRPVAGDLKELFARSKF